MDDAEMKAAYERAKEQDIMTRLLEFVNLDTVLWDAVYEIRDLRKQIRLLEAERDQWQRLANQ